MSGGGREVLLQEGGRRGPATRAPDKRGPSRGTRSGKALHSGAPAKAESNTVTQAGVKGTRRFQETEFQTRCRLNVLSQGAAGPESGRAGSALPVTRRERAGSRGGRGRRVGDAGPAQATGHAGSSLHGFTTARFPETFTTPMAVTALPKENP